MATIKGTSHMNANWFKEQLLKLDPTRVFSVNTFHNVLAQNSKRVIWDECV